MNWYPAPPVIGTAVHTAMPQTLRRREVTEWSRANKGGAVVDSFIEGPCFDPHGNLYIVDIPHGRIMRISPEREWSVVAEYDGEPNGLAWHPDGRVLIADYKNGILALDPASGAITPVIARRNSERFKGRATAISTSPIRARRVCTIPLGGSTGCVRMAGSTV
jgi:gluconolactonase